MFRYLGKNKRGVPAFDSKWHVPPLWVGLSLLLVGFFLVGARLWEILHGKLSFHIVISLLAGGLASWYGVWALILNRRMPRLCTAEEACFDIQVDREEFFALARARGIRPRYIINGREFYDPADFSDVATLLRPAAPPDNPKETLLRPASHVETPPDQLLRAADPTEQNK